MLDKTATIFIIADALLAASGGLMLWMVLITRADMHRPQTTSNVAQNLLLMQTPLTGALFNGGLVLFTFTVSIPGIIFQRSRVWLKAYGCLLVLCALITLVLGLEIWFTTLRTRANLGFLWDRQSAHDQRVLQEKFGCCGYFNSNSPPFQKDPICPNLAEAAKRPGCVGPFSNYANSLLNIIFTSLFGFASLDVVLLLGAVVLLKQSAEKERYRYIDEKNGYAGI